MVSRSQFHALPVEGYFFHPQFAPDCVQVESTVDLAWDVAERAAVVQYLEAGAVGARFRGSSTCRVCGDRNGSTELHDGTYRWPQGFVHYVRDHGVKPSEAFLSHVLAQTGQQQVSQ